MPVTDIITPDYIRNAILPTIKFVDRSGNPIPDDFFYQRIDTAVSTVEGRTGITLRADYRKLHEERHDSLEWHDGTWFLKKPLKRPIREVERFGFVYGNFTPDYLPSDWIYLASKKMGQVQIIPGPTGVNLRTFHYWFPHPWDTGAHYMAGLVKIDYYAGYDVPVDGTHTVAAGSTNVVITGATDIALDFQPGDWVKLGANVRRIASVIDGQTYRLSAPATAAHASSAIHLQYPGVVLTAVSGLVGAAVLELMGTLLYGPGVTAKSLSMDGMSQSKGFNPRGPYASWRQELLDAAEKAMTALYIDHTPIRSFAI